MGTEHSSSKKEESKKAEHKSSCNDKSCKDCNDDNKNEGACKQHSCRCSLSTSPINLVSPFDLKQTLQFAEGKKQTFGFTQAYYSSGYYSIWQPPKIS